MKTVVAGIMCCAALPLCGCATDLRTGGLAEQTPAALPVGFVYYLPAATVAPSAALRIAGCPPDEEAAKKLAGRNDKKAVPIKEVQLAMSGDVAVEQVQGLPVVIDYRELGDFLKTTSLTLERQPNGMLKSVGMTIEDESPAVIANGAVIAANIALAATGAPVVGATTIAALGIKAAGSSPFKGRPDINMLPEPTTLPVKYVACKAATVELLAKREKAAEAKATNTRDLEETNAGLAKLLRDTDPGLTPKENEQVREYRSHILALTASLAAASETLNGIDARLSLKLAVPDGTAVTVDAITKNGIPLGADKALDAFVKQHFEVVNAEILSSDTGWFASRTCVKGVPGPCDSEDKVIAALKPRAVATLVATKVVAPGDGHTPDFAGVTGPKSPKPQKGRSGPVRPGQGIVYVEPARYIFTLKQPAIATDSAPSETVLKAVKASVPQLGTYFALPVHAGFGEKVTLNATFNADGSLATASYGKPTSAAKAISGSLAGLAEKYVSTYDAVQDRKLKLLKSQADQLAARKAILTAQDALKDDPLADVNAQIASITAQAVLAEANLRLNAANKKLAGE